MSLGKASHTLLIGNSGSGKTYMLTLLCDAAGIPFVKKSMANLSSEGYKGENLSEILNAISEKPDFIAKLSGQSRATPNKAIVFLDEIDKIALTNDGESSFFARKLQQELLAWYTGEKIHGVDTSQFLIVGAGAFSGGFGRKSLYQIIQHRLGGSQAQLNEQALLDNLTDADLVEFGFMPELVGRIVNKAPLRPINEEGLYRILAEKKSSPARAVIEHFKQMGINLSFDDDALKEIARIATSGVGVRGLHSIVNELTEPLSFDRKKHQGKTINLTADDVRQKFDYKPEFVQPDDFEIDWRNPNSIVEYLDLYVAGQHEAKRDLAKAFHLYHMGLQKEGVKLPQSNVILIGPSGSGKTYMVELLAKKAQLPIAKTNIASVVPSIIPGPHFSDVFDQLGRSETGIVYVDEADKVLGERNHPINTELIGSLENGEVNGRKTGRYLFVLSGAFQPIYDAKLAEKVDASKSIGFGTARGEAEQSYAGIKVGRQDLSHYGVPKEILGRIPIITNVEALTVSDLAEILTKRNSVLEQYKQYFASMGKTIDIEPGALEVMAEKAKGLEGARALSEVASKLFNSYIMNQVEGKEIKITTEEARRIL